MNNKIEQNQCDGCAQNLPIRDGIHQTMGMGISCTAGIYNTIEHPQEVKRVLTEIKQRILEDKAKIVSNDFSVATVRTSKGYNRSIMLIDEFIKEHCDE